MPVTIINFTIDGTEYQADAGMKWVQWVESNYNTAGFQVDPDMEYILTSSGDLKVITAGDSVCRNDPIRAEAYGLADPDA